jgi:hypothetical protein
MNVRRKTVWVLFSGLTVLLLTGAWSVFGENGWANEPWSDLSLEGIWTTMTPTPAGTSAIMSLVISAQGSEGAVYTCIGKHPECSVTAYGLSPEAESVSDLLGYLVRTGASTFQFSVVCQGIKKGGPEVLNVGETLYMVVLSGNAELMDRDTLVIREFTYAAYLPDQDIDGNRLPDEGAVPVTSVTMPQLPFKRLLLFPPIEPAPIDQSSN